MVWDVFICRPGKSQPVLTRALLVLALCTAVSFVSGCAASEETRSDADTQTPYLSEGGSFSEDDSREYYPEEVYGGDYEGTTNDPFETFNRASFEFNIKLDEFVLDPVATAYTDIVPEDGRKSVSNLISHYRAPVSLVNALLQGEMTRVGDVLGRFLVNSIIGIGGLFDPATHVGLPEVNEDFGQTLARWGVESGPYLMLPFLGPSNPRDLLGRGVDTFADPLTYVFNGQNYGFQASMMRSGTSAVSQRAKIGDALDEMRAGSLDFYAAVRSLSRQRRNSEIHNGMVHPSVLPGPQSPAIDDIPQSSAGETGATDNDGRNGSTPPEQAPDLLPEYQDEQPDNTDTMYIN